MSDNFPEDLDFSKIDIPESKTPRLYSSPLSQLDYAKILVISKLIKKSQSAIAQTAILTYLNRNWEKHLKRLCVEAKQKGITPEEYFEELLKSDSKEKNE